MKICVFLWEFYSFRSYTELCDRSELLSMCGVRCGPPFILLPWEFQLSQHQLLKRLSFSHWMVLALLSKGTWPYPWGLYLSSLFYSIGLYICLEARTTRFDYPSCVVSFEVRKCETSNFVLFFQHRFEYLESLEIPCGFYDAFFCLF